MAVVAWPTDDYFTNYHEFQELGALSAILQLRMLDEFREKQGVTYAPGATRSASKVFPGFAAASLDRLSRVGRAGLPSEVIRSWLLDLRKSRERLLALAEAALGKVEAVSGRLAAVKPATLRTAMARSREANCIIELLMTCDALIDRYWRLNDDAWAADGVDTAIPRRLAARLHDVEREFIAGLLTNDAFSLEVGIEYQLFPELGWTRNLIEVHDRAEQARALLPILGSGRELVLSMEEDRVVGIDEFVPA